MADSDKFKNAYRVKSHRHPDWDYSDPGGYFITALSEKRPRQGFFHQQLPSILVEQ